jgi:hypothetical protein
VCCGFFCGFFQQLHVLEFTVFQFMCLSVVPLLFPSRLTLFLFHSWWQAHFTTSADLQTVKLHFIGFPDSNDETVPAALGEFSKIFALLCARFFSCVCFNLSDCISIHLTFGQLPIVCASTLQVVPA